MGIYGNYITENNQIISSDIIKNISSNFVHTEYLNESGIIDNLIDTTMKFLEDLGLNAKLTIDCIKEASNNIIKIIKNDGINGKSTKEIFVQIDNVFQRVADNIHPEDINTDKFKSYDITKIRSALLLFVFMYIISFMINLILVLLLGSSMGNILTIAIVGPIIEELAKQTAVKGNFIVEFQVVFNTFEIVKYTRKAPVVKLGYLQLFKARLKVAAMHITTSIIQWMTNNTDITGIENKETISVIGNIIGILIHGSWNSLSLFNERFVRLIIGK